MDSSDAQIASQKFADGYNCAQAVLFAFWKTAGSAYDGPALG